MAEIKRKVKKSNIYVSNRITEQSQTFPETVMIVMTIKENNAHTNGSEQHCLFRIKPKHTTKQDTSPRGHKTHSLTHQWSGAEQAQRIHLSPCKTTPGAQTKKRVTCTLM